MKHKLKGRTVSSLNLPVQTYGKHILPLLVLLLMAFVGLSFLYLSHAASPAISAQPEVGTLSGTATSVADATASGGAAVQFKAPTGPPPTGGGTSPSWNPNISCKAVVTTIEGVLGSQKSSLGGATFAGGGFTPGVPDRRSTAQPCAVNGRPVFVEIHGVTMGSCAHFGNDGDWSCELRDPATPPPPNCDPLKCMHIEIDGNMIAKGWGPAYPPGGKLLDVQGFVFWDSSHTTAAFHHYSGWELHSFTAWRLAQ